ncbi:MAG: AMP-binding protein, partial [Gammaproteobacteria bacterium]|nr:AMP-binding protein [Gammaproteobacteria bacterium]
MSILGKVSAGNTLGQLFEERVAATPDAVAYVEYSHVLGKWFRHSWESVHEQVGRAQFLLQALGLEAGDRIGIMAHGGTYWVTLDLAAASLGIVTVPLYHRDRGGNVVYVAERSRMRALFIGGHAQWQELENERVRMPGVEHIFSAIRIPDTEVRPFPLELSNIAPSLYRVTQNDPDSIATIVFTSGTTGRPKGVQLTHVNILSNAIAATAAVPIGPEDRLLSFLPLSHMFERTVGYYSPMLHGSTVAFARSVATLREDLRLQPPTIMVSVPRVYEKIYRTLTSRRPLNSPVGRLLVSLGRRAGRAGPLSLWRVLGLLPRRLIGKKVLQGLGGHLRIAITGGAAMNSSVADFFAGIGLKVL